MTRVKFCGCIVGSVPKRKGETDEQAISRAQDTLLALLERGAKTLGNDGRGPNVGLEADT